MASKTVLLLLGVLLSVITQVSSADNEEKLILKAPYAKVPTPARVKAPAPSKVPVKAPPPTPAPVTKTPPPLPPVTKPLPPPLPPVAKPPPTLPPVTNPPPPAPVTKPPPTLPPVMPPAAPPLPPVRSKADCIPLCDQRCKLHSRKRVCTRACMTCCDRCKCVPPGTYGNREQCGKCYTNMTTHGNRIKCP